MHSQLGILGETDGQLLEHDLGLLVSGDGLVLGAGDRLSRWGWRQAERAAESELQVEGQRPRLWKGTETRARAGT